MSSWSMVEQNVDTAAFLREEGDPLTSPRITDLDERSQKQARLAHKSIRGLIKAGVVGEGKVRIGASGYTHHDSAKMSLDPSQADFVAIHIGRVI
jgi:hypothetical protein